MYNNPANPAWLAKRFRANQLGKSYLLESGKMNPWDLPEFDTARQGILKERDLGLSDYIGKLTRSGVTGPSAALSLEKANQGYGNNLLNLAHKMRTSYTDRGLNVGSSILDQANKETQMGLAWRAQHDARQQQPSSFENIAKMIMGGAMSAASAYNMYKQGQSYANGGVIDEPIVGTGLESGQEYTFGEEGPETIIPLRAPEENDDIFNQNNQQQGGGQPQMSPQMVLNYMRQMNIGPFASQGVGGASQAGSAAGSQATAGMMNGTGGASSGSSAAGGMGAMGPLAYIAAAVAAREAMGERGAGWIKGGVDDDVTRNLKSIGKALSSYNNFTAGNMAGFGGGGLSKVQDVVSGKLTDLRKKDFMWAVDPIGQLISKLWK